MVLGLFDGRLMAIECKVSNTRVNSFKRLNHEAVDKAVKWNNMFGANGIISACVLQGLYSPDNLEAAQDDIYIFWSHDLGRLVDYVLSTKG